MQGNLRMIILKALESTPCSGYDLMDRIAKQLGKKPSPGSMYPLLESLHKQGRIRKKVEGRKNVFSLTQQGRSEVKKLSKMKEELFRNMEKNVRMWGMLCGEDVSAQMQALHKMRTDEYPFGEIKDSSNDLKKAILSLYLKKQISRNARKINEILERATAELRKL